MKSNFANVDIPLRDIQDHRRQKFQVRPPEPEGAPKKRPWPVVAGDGRQAAVFTVTRDKSGEITTATQVRPFPRTDDDGPGNRGVRFEVVALEIVNLGMGVQVPAGCRCDLMASVAMTMYQAGTGKILKETRP